MHSQANFESNFEKSAESQDDKKRNNYSERRERRYIEDGDRKYRGTSKEREHSSSKFPSKRSSEAIGDTFSHGSKRSFDEIQRNNYSSESQKKNSVESPSSLQETQSTTSFENSPQENAKSLSSDLLRKKLGFELYTKYNEEREASKSTLDKEYANHEADGSRHPSYKKIYYQFLNDYNSQFGKMKDENHRKSFWKEFWKMKIHELKKNEWAESELRLQNKFLGIVQEEIEKNKEQNHKASFSPTSCVQLLQILSPALGIIGLSLSEVLKKAQKTGPETVEGLQIFVDEEVEALISMVLNKFETCKAAAPKEGVEVFGRAISWTNLLLERAKNTPFIMPDIVKLAHSTMGQGTAVIIETIRQSFRAKNQRMPEQEKLNKIFIDICNIQFNVAIQNLPSK